jgi:pimeloyl-ACP methyl ester carboxylesterase
LDEFDVTDAVVVGHSLGGWIAMHFAAITDRCRALIYLDGPTALGYEEMGLTPSHPGFVPDPPDVVADLDAVGCATLLTPSSGSSPAEAEWMVPFR